MDKFTYSDDDDDSADRLTLNVGGVKFETYITTLQNISDTRLAWLIENVDQEILHSKEFFFDRHPGAFVHILNYYRTGKLHTPTDICGPAFEEELQFWGIDEKQMEPCCWESFTKHREAEENLRNFEGPGFEDLRFDRKLSACSNSSESRRCFKFDFNKLWLILEDPHSSQLAKRFSLLSCVMIIMSISVYCLDTLPMMENNQYLDIINYICLTFFTLELLARIIVTPDRKEFFKNYKNWIDILSVLPSYMLIFLHKKWMKNFVIIRILRVFKFFKLSYGLQVLVHSLKASSYELTLLLLILLIPVVIFSSLVYAVEIAYNSDSKFDSVPRTFWWCIITMTTVGYGDLTPKTWPGQIIGSICSICGLLIVALPISVIGSNFSLYYAHVRARLKLPKKNRTLLQGKLRGLLRQPLSLSSRDRDRKSIRRNINTTTRCQTQEILAKQILETNTFDQISNGTADSTYTDHVHTDTGSITNNRSSNTSYTRSQERRRAAIVAVMTDTDSYDEMTGTRENVGLLEKEASRSVQNELNDDVSSSELDFMNNEKQDKYPIKYLEIKTPRPRANTCNVLVGEKAENLDENTLPIELQISQTLFSPIFKSKNPPERNIENFNRRSVRRGALALRAQQSSSDESEPDHRTDTSTDCLDVPTFQVLNKSDTVVQAHSDSDVTEVKRRISMRMLTSFDDVSFKSGEEKCSISANSTENESRKSPPIKVVENMNGFKENNNHQTSFNSDKKYHPLFNDENYDELALFRSQTERKPKPKLILLPSKVKSENDLRKFESVLPEKNIQFSYDVFIKESGV